MRNRILAAGLVALVLAPLTGCGKSTDGPAVASAGSAPAGPSPSASLSTLEQGIRYARCMREHGVPMPDPEVNGDTVRLRGADKDAVDAATLGRAQEACRALAPVLSGPDLATKMEQAREEARCMREHGVEIFPDPQPDLSNDLPLSVRDDPQYEQAKVVCREQVRRYGQ